MKAKYQFTEKSSNAEPLTEELFTKLNGAYQLLANLAVAADIEVAVADYNGNKFLDRVTIDAMKEYYFD